MKNFVRNIDFVIIAAMTCLLFVSVFTIYSAGYARGMEKLAFTQLTWFAAGLIIIGITQYISMKSVLAVSNLFYAILIVMLILVYLIGSVRMGAKRWIEIGTFQFQPSEVGKFFLLCTLARYYSVGKINWNDKKYFITGLILTVVPALLVLKQPDLVLAQFLQGDLFTLEEKRRNFAYYEPITTGDSSLSHCIQSIMAAEIGETAKAWDYFHKTVRMDIDDLHHNVHDGIHAAAMAGSWLSVIYGFGGFREHLLTGADGMQAVQFSFNPVLPEALTSLRFRLDLGSGVVELDCSRGEGGAQITVYRLIGGGSARFLHGTEPVELDESNKETCVRGTGYE